VNLGPEGRASRVGLPPSFRSTEPAVVAISNYETRGISEDPDCASEVAKKIGQRAAD